MFDKLARFGVHFAPYDHYMATVAALGGTPKLPTPPPVLLDASPADLADRGKPFPVEAYFNGILKGYETKVIN